MVVLVLVIKAAILFAVVVIVEVVVVVYVVVVVETLEAARELLNNKSHIMLYEIITIIGSTALRGPRPLQAIVASDLYPGQSPASFYNPVSLRLFLPRQSILISVGYVLVDLQG